MAPPTIRSARNTLARVGSGPRYAAALACVLLAVVSGIEEGTQSTPRFAPVATGPLVVTTHRVTVGRVLTMKDVRIARWPTSLRPPGALTARRAAVGHRLSGSLATGEPVTPRRLLTPALADDLGRDTVAVSVDVDTDVRGLVQTGGRVDLVAVARPDLTLDTPTSHARASPRARSVCQRTLVLAVLPGPAANPGGTQVVLAVSRDVGLRIAALRSTQMFTFVAAVP